MESTTYLRIGNYVRYGNNVCKVCHIGLSVVDVQFVISGDDVTNDFESVNITDVRPILLTTEMLEKIGFERGGYYTKVVNGISIEICLDGDVPMYLRSINRNGWDYCLCHPTYVHELQNLLYPYKLDKVIEL